MSVESNEFTMDRGDARRAGAVQDGEPLDTYDTRQVIQPLY